MFGTVCKMGDACRTLSWHGTWIQGATGIQTSSNPGVTFSTGTLTDSGEIVNSNRCSYSGGPSNVENIVYAQLGAFRNCP
jgi:hypothetical protein